MKLPIAALSFRPLRYICASLLIGFSLAGLGYAQGLPDEMPVQRGDLMVRKAGAILIDVRSPSEWRQTGIPVTAHTVSMDDPQFLARVAEITGGNSAQRIAVISQLGIRSSQARETLRAAGYTNVTSITGGVIGPEGWIDSDLPVRPYR